MNYILNNNRINEIIDNFDNLLNTYKVDSVKSMFEDISTEIRIKMLIYACGICNNMNWDYLCNNFMYKLKLYSRDFDTDFLVDIDESVIKKFFEEYPKKHKIEAQRRTEMIRSISKDLFANTNIVDDILKVKRLNGEKGLFDNINNRIEVFNQDKKLNLFRAKEFDDIQIDWEGKGGVTVDQLANQFD